jgi:long-chain acyl-CoA synthetase
VGVPRVFEAIKDKIEEKVKKKVFILRWLFKFTMKYKIRDQKKGVFSHWLLDLLIFGQIKKEFGGSIRGALSGSAALNPLVCEYMQAIFSCRIFQGYGQTEATAANIVMPEGNYENDAVGIPFPTNQVKLVEVGKYDGVTEGEICLKGDNVSKGYYKRQDLTEEAFDGDGWLRTGDIGSISSGLFRVIGRRKEIFKTSLGEYIIPERVEGALKGGAITDLLITSRPYSSFVVGLVVCKDLNINTEEIYKKITERGENCCKRGMISKFEIPKKIHVVREDFEDLGEFITPTGKKRRKLIEDYFYSEIDEMYKE